MKESEGERLAVGGIELETLSRGNGSTLLLLHGFDTIPSNARFLDRLARRFRIVAPSCPGFGASPRPDDVTHVYDLVHLYLALLETLPAKASVIGFSFGGWLAAEMAVSCSHRIEKLVLVDALGIKVSGRETPDILDIFNRHPQEVARARWHEPETWALDFDHMSDEEITRHARNREALCLYGWNPYMHNANLKRWLAAIKAPTLVLWGAQDGIVKPSYGRVYADLIPGARFSLIEDAGHHPEIEQPDVFAERVASFLER